MTTEKKKQHYVPRFYLKLFSNKNEDSHLGVYVKGTKTYVQDAQLKNQAYENFFYGKDGVIEDAFAKIEREASIVFKSIIQNNVLPKKSSEEYETLWTFTLLQTARTKLAVKEKELMLNKTLKNMMKYDERVKDIADKVEFELTDPTGQNLETLLSSMHVAQDLDYKLIINNTNTPFITSDSPVWKYNQFLEDRKHPFGKLGLAIKGLKIFYPLTPRLLLLLYDPKVYKINLRKRTAIETKNQYDIDQINLLQFLNSDEVIFLNDKISEYYIRQLHEKSLKFEIDDKHLIRESEKVTKADGTSSMIVYQTSLSYDIKLNLSFLSYSDHAKHYKMTGMAAELRDENYRHNR